MFENRGKQMTFTYIDGIYLGIIALFIVLCTVRGFAKTVLNFFGGAVRLIAAFFLCKPVALLIGKWTHADERLASKFFAWASGLSEPFNTNLIGMSEVDLESHVNLALSDAKFPRMLRGIFKSLFTITPETIAGHESITMADIVGLAIAKFLLVAICFVGLYILFFVLIFILKRILKKVFAANRVLFKTDKILGAVLGLVEGLFVVTVILSVLTIFKNSAVFSGFFETMNKSVIVKPISNLIFKFIDNYFKFNTWL